MKTSLRISSLRSFLTIAALLLATLAVVPSAFADLPSSVASRVKKINKMLDAVDAALEVDRLQTAQRKLKDTERPLKEISARYSGKFDESDAAYKAMLERLASTTERVTVAEKDAADTQKAGADARRAHEAHCQEWFDKLRPFVDRSSKKYLRIGSDLNAASAEEQALCKAAYAEAKELFAAYQKVKFALAKTPVLKNVESSLSSSMKYYGQDETKAAQEAACKEWVDRLAPYVDVGMRSERKLIASPTIDAQQSTRQKELYEEAMAIFALYQKEGFPLGKSFRLQTLEDAMVETLAEFPKAMQQSQAMMSGDVGTRLDQVLRHIDRDTAWKQDTTKRPLVISESNLAPLREGIEKYAGTVPSDDATLASLRKKLRAIEQHNAERRTVGARRTFQRADGYSGADLEPLKEKARAIAAEAHPNAKIHLVTVPSSDWVVEDVVEFTDTTKSALRHRITRSVRAEVSLTHADGSAWLQEVYVAQNRLPDGGWSKLLAHTTWVDAMAAENLGTPPPTRKGQPG